MDDAEILDLHGSSHSEGQHKIEKFITDNLDTLPVRVITGHSPVFTQCVQDISKKYELFCYKQYHTNAGCWVVIKSPWF